MQVRALEETAVHEEVLIAEHLSGSIGTSYKSPYCHQRRFCSDVDKVVHHCRSHQVPYSELERHCRLEHIDILSVMGKGESYFRTGQGYSCELCDDMLELDVVGLEELPSCRNVVEKVSYTEIGALRCCCLLGREVTRVCKIHLTAQFAVLLTGLEGHFCHRRYGSQGFSAESECKYVVQVFCCLEF